VHAFLRGFDGADDEGGSLCKSFEQLLSVILPGVVERRKTSLAVAGLAHAGSLAEQALRHVGSQIQIRTGAVAVFAAAIASEDAGIAIGTAASPLLHTLRLYYA